MPPLPKFASDPEELLQLASEGRAYDGSVQRVRQDTMDAAYLNEQMKTDPSVVFFKQVRENGVLVTKAIVRGSLDDAAAEMQESHCEPGMGLDFDVAPGTNWPIAVGVWKGAVDSRVVYAMVMSKLAQTKAESEEKTSAFAPQVGAFPLDPTKKGRDVAKKITLDALFEKIERVRAGGEGTGGASGDEV